MKKQVEDPDPKPSKREDGTPCLQEALPVFCSDSASKWSWLKHHAACSQALHSRNTVHCVLLVLVADFEIWMSFIERQMCFNKFGGQQMSFVMEQLCVWCWTHRKLPGQCKSAESLESPLSMRNKIYPQCLTMSVMLKLILTGSFQGNANQLRYLRVP